MMPMVVTSEMAVQMRNQDLMTASPQRRSARRMLVPIALAAVLLAAGVPEVSGMSGMSGRFSVSGRGQSSGLLP
jgi:hypothetical protein